MRFKSKSWLPVLASFIVLSFAGPAAAQGSGEANEANSRFLTVGVFERDGDEYRRLDQFLEFELGVRCYVWHRTADGDEYDSRPHEHYDAAGDTRYDGETFAWTEYGPKHTEVDAFELCESGQGGVPKEVNWTEYTEERHGDRDPYYLKIVGFDACPTLAHECVDVGEYRGPNAIPAVTMQILPSSGGDTVTNDAEYPPGQGEKVVVGFWEHPEDYEPGEDENPCTGEPVFKIAYPLEYGSRTCYGWKHWVADECEDGPPSFHENSAKKFSCSDDGELHLTQWTTMDCTPGAVGAGCTNKTAFRTRCCRDNPPTIWSQILSGCGKSP